MQDTKKNNIAKSNTEFSLCAISENLKANIKETIEEYAFPNHAKLKKDYLFFSRQKTTGAKEKALAIKKELSEQKLSSDSQIIAFLIKYLCEECENFGLFLRYSNETGGFYIYNGVHYETIEEIDVLEIIKTVAKALSIKERVYLTEKFLSVCLKQIKLCYCRFSPNKYVGENVKINLKNGILEIDILGRETLHPHNPKENFCYVTEFAYDKNAKCPKFLNFLGEVIDDKKTIELLLEHLAYLLIPNNSRYLKLEKIPILLGSGANGKSTFMEVTIRLFGKANVTHYSFSELAKETHRAQIVGKILNYSSELSKNIDSEQVKKWASGEAITVRKLYQEPVETNNYAKLICNANELATNVEESNGFFRRFNIIEFTKTIPLEKQNPNLHLELAKELSGILNLMLYYLRQLVKNQAFTNSENVNKRNEKYRQNLDSVFQFINDYGLEIGYTPIRLQYVYEKYNEYAKKNGFSALGKIKFTENLRQKGFEVRQHANNTMCVFFKDNARELLENYSYYLA